MPTGVAIHDARAQLFDAAERVLLRDGPNALTSRAVTTEAGVAKGVLHRHFADFDTFLADLVVHRIARLDEQATGLHPGAGTVADNLTSALTSLFGPVGRSILALVTSRDELRARLRATTPTGVPILTEGTAMIAAYLASERERGRIAQDADTGTLALMLVGTAHMQFAGHDAEPEPAAIRHVVHSVIAGALP